MVPPFTPPLIPWRQAQRLSATPELAPGLDPHRCGVALGRLCAEPDVSAVLVFGSRARREARLDSDLDLAGDRAPAPAHTGREAGLLEAFSWGAGEAGREGRPGGGRQHGCRAAQRLPPRLHELEDLVDLAGQSLDLRLLELQVFAVEACYEEGPFPLPAARDVLLALIEAELDRCTLKVKEQAGLEGREPS